MITAEPETMYELGKLRMAHDHSVNAIWRRRGVSAVVYLDPETIWHLDVLDALIEATTPEDSDV